MLGKSPSAFLMTLERRPSSFWVYGWRWDVTENPGKGHPTHPNMQCMSSWHRDTGSHTVCLPVHNCLITALTDNLLITLLPGRTILKFLSSRLSTKVTTTDSHITKQHTYVTYMTTCVTLTSLSHSLSHIETKNMTVCIYLK